MGKHRKRRRRAQLKLARTQDNLDRALDVEREARSRLRPLKRQAEAAELHARLERQSLEARWELARDDVRARRSALSEAESRRGHGAGSPGAGRAARCRWWRNGARTPRRPWPGAAPSARSSHAATSPPARPASASAIAATPCAPAPRRSRRGSPGPGRSSNRSPSRTAPTPPILRRRAGSPRSRTSLEALDRDREAELARQLAELEQQLEQAAGEVAQRGERGRRGAGRARARRDQGGGGAPGPARGRT